MRCLAIDWQSGLRQSTQRQRCCWGAQTSVRRRQSASTRCVLGCDCGTSSPIGGTAVHTPRASVRHRVFVLTRLAATDRRARCLRGVTKVLVRYGTGRVHTGYMYRVHELRCVGGECQFTGDSACLAVPRKTSPDRHRGSALMTGHPSPSSANSHGCISNLPCADMCDRCWSRWTRDCTTARAPRP